MIDSVDRVSPFATVGGARPRAFVAFFDLCNGEVEMARFFLRFD